MNQYDVAKWCNLYRRALSAAKNGRRGAPPVIKNISITAWADSPLRDEVELGKRVASDMMHENWDYIAPWVRADYIIARYFQANPPTSFLSILPTGERGTNARRLLRL